jgi:methanethiol oxidase
MDCEAFDILGCWEIDRRPQNLHYDFWWNLPQFENGIAPEESALE